MSVKKEPRARKPRRPPAAVVALPGCNRPEDALSRLQELLAGAERPEGVIVIALGNSTGAEPRIFGFGRLNPQRLTWSAVRLMVDAVHMEADG